MGPANKCLTSLVNYLILYDMTEKKSSLEQLLDLWKEDSKIDAVDLSAEAQRIYDLHAKYLHLFSIERMRLKLLELEQKRLNLEKFEFYNQGPSKETEEKGWVYPVSGKVIRTDSSKYMDADKQIQELNIKYESCKVKVDALQMIMDAINQRGYILNGMIKREIWTGGGS